MKDWQSKWKLEIADCKLGVGSDYQDPISDCVAEADAEISALKREHEQLIGVLTRWGKLSPHHLRAWADSIDAENGYKDGNLSMWLRTVADAL